MGFLMYMRKGTKRQHIWGRYTLKDVYTYFWDKYQANYIVDRTYFVVQYGGGFTRREMTENTIYFLDRTPPSVTPGGHWDGGAISGTWDGASVGDWVLLSRFGRTAYHISRMYQIEYTWYWDCDSSASIVEKTDGHYEKGTYINQVSDIYKYKYPDNGYSGGYWYVYKKQTGPVKEKGNYIDDVTGFSDDRYPSDGIQGNNWYTKKK